MARKPKTPGKGYLSKGEVGYCRPPAHSQFKPGHSGNPSGRPKRNAAPDELGLLLSAALQKEMQIQEGGRSRKTIKADVIVTQLVNQAVKGDRKAIEMVFKLMAGADRPVAADAVELSPDAVANFLKRHSGEAPHE